MLSDRKAAELISKSLGGQLSDEESAEVQLHLEDDPHSQAFAEASRAIQNTVSEMAALTESGDESVAPGLSEEAKERMRSSLREASKAHRRSRVGSHNARFVSQPASDEQLRQIRARFHLLRKIGEGGFGTVWFARDEKLKRTVAIKEMNPDALESPKAWSRFLREAQITGHLEHPSIVPLYQFGEDVDTGQPFYAMRFVGKRTLADAVIEYHERRLAGASKELDLHRLLLAFLRVCQAMAYVHSRGVVHRDLKPENVAVDDSLGEVVILDWGLANFVVDGELGTRLSVECEREDSVLAQTLDGDVVGTPLYMAPEQAAGDFDKVDEKTDVYGLGAILFAILTGSAPHEKSNTSPDGDLQVQALLKAIADSETPAPGDVNRDTPGGLAAICMKAMAKKRHMRHASARELAEDVERWLAGQREKPIQYDNMRMEGRELRANLDSVVLDLGKNVRFMANLPPIQGIIDARSGSGEEPETVWRDRLTMIFKGLLRTNTDYSAVIYCRIENSTSIEIVRVERHSTDRANIRSVPASRLESFDVNDFVDQVMRQKPEEVFTALAASGQAGNNMRHERRLAAGVPVFNERTEEAFGYVLIECDFRSVLENQVRRRVRVAQQVFLADTEATVWVCESNQVGDGDACQLAESSIPELESIVRTVAAQDEFVDATNHEVYAARLDLVPNVSTLTLVLTSKNAISSR